MKKLAVLILALVALFSFSGCGSSVPSEVSEYAKKHELEVLSADKLKSSAIVGKDYVVYGTVSYISFYNYERGSADLEELLSKRETDFDKEMAEILYAGKMSYYVSFSGGPFMDYDDYNFSTRMLRINKGDEVAFIVTCEDGYSAGTYEYTIKEKIWENRHSETTIEEDHDARLETY